MIFINLSVHKLIRLHIFSDVSVHTRDVVILYRVHGYPRISDKIIGKLADTSNQPDISSLSIILSDLLKAFDTIKGQALHALCVIICTPE